MTSSMKLLGYFKINVMCSLQVIGGKKVYIFGLGHMTKMAAMPIYGKKHKKSSSPEPLADGFET